MKYPALALFLLAPLLAHTQRLVQDLNPGPAGSTPELEFLSGQTAVFAGVSPAYGRELWKTNGACEQTVLLLDINPGAPDGNPQHLTRIGNLIYFSADDGMHGQELWVTDGTPGGTRMIRDIYPGVTSSYPEDFLQAGPYVYFTAVDIAHGKELWRTDGTAAGTLMIKDVLPGVAAGAPAFNQKVAYKDSLFFSVFDFAFGHSLWKTGGTFASTSLVKDYINGSTNGGGVDLTVFNNLLFLSVTDAVYGQELWRSDGSAAGTYILKDIHPGPEGAQTAGVSQAVGAFLYFAADDGINGRELWKTDGTSAGTVLVKDLNPGPASANILNKAAYDGTLYFIAEDGTSGLELWRSDGTGTGTYRVKDIRPGSQGSMSSNIDLMRMTDGLYFAADDGIHGLELWRSDGTGAGTQLVIDLEPGSDGSSTTQLTNLNNTLIWSANTSITGKEPYINLPPPSGGPALVVDIDTVQSPSCHFSSDGHIGISVTQGVCPYFFYWSNGARTEDLHDIAYDQTGYYSVTVVDAAGHEAVLDSMLILRPEPLQLETVEYARADCNGNPGHITLTGTGGTLPYQFVWSDGYVGATRNPVPAGSSYSVTLVDAGGCNADSLFDFEPVLPPSVVFGNYTATCTGNTLFIAPQGPGLNDLAYQWTATNGGLILSSPDSLGIQVVGPGLFHLTTTDPENGCETVQTVEVGIDTIAPTAMAGPDLHLPCSADPFTMLAGFDMNGSSGSPQFLWTAYDGGRFVDDQQRFLLNPNANHTGVYVFRVTNAGNGCSDTDTLVVTATQFAPVFFASGGSLSCLVDEAMLQVDLGSDQLVFEGWTGPGGFSSPESSPVVSLPGEYTAFATDTTTGCSGTATALVQNNQEAPNVTVLVWNTLGCNRPTTNIQAFSFISQAPYTYAWSGPNGFSGTGTVVVASQAGNYILVATHLLTGCTSTYQVEVTGSSQMTLALAGLVDVVCPNAADGSAEVEVNGGDGNYTYQWSNGETGALAENLVPGTYSVTVNDGSGCVGELSITISGTDTLAPQLICPPNQVVGACQGTVVYDLPQVLDNCPPEPSLLVQTEGLPGGSLFPTGIVRNRFVYTDPGGRQDTCSFTVEVREPPVLSASALPASCHQGCDGTISLQISGDPPYTLLWSGGTGENLCAGVYAVTVLDAYGCADQQTDLIITEPDALFMSIDSIVADIGGQGVGAIFGSAGGGVPPLTFLWTQLSTGQSYTEEDISGLTTGYYQCVMTDANDCTFTSDSVFVDNLVSVSPTDRSGNIQLYPNPARDRVSLEIPGIGNEQIDVAVFNAIGQRIAINITIESSGRLWLDTSNLISGVYSVYIRADRWQAVRSFVLAVD